jgi:hypothetical protein
MKTYAQFREELEKLVIEYASECNAAISVKIDVAKEEIYNADNLDNVVYDAEIQTMLK